jgi:predicted ABC-type ATPase
MVVPVVAGIPLVYEMLVGAGILAGGAVAANQMQKEIQTTIDKNPEIIDQALKNIFTGPASRLIDPNFLKEMQAKKPTPTNQGQTNWSDSFKKKAPAAEEDIMKGSLFYEQTPSGIYLGPTVGGIEKGREEARSKPLITPMPVGQQDQTLVTPVPEKTTVLPGMDPAPTPIQNEGFSMPTTPDTSILNQDKPEETKNQIKTWETIGNFKNIEEAKQRAEKAGIPFNEVELAGLKQQITFKKDYAGYDAYFNGKLIGRMDDVTEGLKDSHPDIYKGNQKTFNLSFLDSRGNMDRATDTVDTIAEAKYMMKKLLAKDLLDKESLTRRNFENQKYDKKGNPIVEEYKIETKDLGDMSPLEQEAVKQTLNRTSNPSGSLIDKPAQIELPDKAALKEESKLGDELFKLSETGTVQDYETFKNNPIIKKKIALSKQLYKDTTANPGYGTAEYWADRPFTKGVNGYKELVKKVYDRKKIKNNKEFYIVMGPSSAGKSTGLVDKLQKETGSFLADSDEIKKLIPEFNNGYNANGVHAESSDINSRILAMAMKAGDNVIYPTTGREAGKLKGIIDNAEKRGYKVYVDLVTADRSVLLLRNLARMLKTNRVVNGDELLTEEVINGILETYNNLDEKYKRGKPIDTTKR